MRPAREGRGWGTVLALGIVAAAFSVVQPVLLIFVPLALMLVALPPHRPLPLLLSVVLLGVLFSRPVADPFWYFERGWVLVVGAWFLCTVVVWPRAQFLSRALAALGAATLTAGALFVANGPAFGRIDTALAERLRAGAADVLRAWNTALGSSRFGTELSDTIYRAADLQALLFPALLGLASLAALAVAWWSYRRVAAREAEPLSPFREFRFPDGLIWLLIAGILLMVLPLDGMADRAGSNLLAFMAALYALRGVAVLLMVGGAPGPFGMLIWGLLVLFLYPLVMAATFVVGLTDTWLDIRRRRVPSRPGS